MHGCEYHACVKLSRHSVFSKLSKMPPRAKYCVIATLLCPWNCGFYSYRLRVTPLCFITTESGEMGLTSTLSTAANSYTPPRVHYALRRMQSLEPPPPPGPPLVTQRSAGSPVRLQASGASRILLAKSDGGHHKHVSELDPS